MFRFFESREVRRRLLENALAGTGLASHEYVAKLLRRLSAAIEQQGATADDQLLEVMANLPLSLLEMLLGDIACGGGKITLFKVPVAPNEALEKAILCWIEGGKLSRREVFEPDVVQFYSRAHGDDDPPLTLDTLSDQDLAEEFVHMHVTAYQRRMLVDMTLTEILTESPEPKRTDSLLQMYFRPHGLDSIDVRILKLAVQCKFGISLEEFVSSVVRGWNQDDRKPEFHSTLRLLIDQFREVANAYCEAKRHHP